MNRFWGRVIRSRRVCDTGSLMSAADNSYAPASSGPLSAAFIDLTDHRDLTFALLDDPKTWRERAVHEIVLRDSDHVNVSTAFQVRLPVDLIRHYAPSVKPGDSVRLLVPFTIRPKQLLLNVNFSAVKGESCALLPRANGSELQAEYLEHLDGESSRDELLLRNLWEGVSGYTVWAWRAIQADTKPRVWRRLLPGFYDLWRIRALAAYLNADLELEIEAADIERWLSQIESARRRLVQALREGEDSESSSECILLAIPFMPVRPNTLQDIETLVEEFCVSVEHMNDVALRALSEYGRRWEAILETVLPVGQACSIKLSEQRPWIGVPPAISAAATPSLTVWRRLARRLRIEAFWPDLDQMLAMGEARTTHVEVRAADHGVVLDRPRITDLVDYRKTLDLIEARETQDAIAIYATGSDERRFARVQVRARVRRGHRILVGWLLALMFAAGVVAIRLPNDEQIVESLALLTFPLTLAGAVVLWRETTSLAERLLRPWRLALVIGISWIWAIALIMLLVRDIS